MTSVSSLITYCCVVFVFSSLFPLSLSFNYCFGCDYLWFIAEFGKLKKKQVRRNLVGVGAWRVFCCSCIPTTFFSGLFTAWRAVERFYARVSIFSSITHRVLSLCLHLSSLNFWHLISAMDVILFSVDCLSILC